jgi:hypothetical protein
MADDSATFNISAYVTKDPNQQKVLNQGATAYANATNDAERNRAMLNTAAGLVAFVPIVGPIMSVIMISLINSTPPVSNGTITWESNFSDIPAPPRGTFEEFAYTSMHHAWIAQDELMRQGKTYGHQDAMVVALADAVEAWNATHEGPERAISRTQTPGFHQVDPIAYVFELLTAKRPPCPTGWTCPPPPETADNSLVGKKTMTVMVNNGPAVRLETVHKVHLNIAKRVEARAKGRALSTSRKVVYVLTLGVAALAAGYGAYRTAKRR